MNDILNAALDAAELAAGIAKQVRASGQIGIDFKGAVNLCTQADLEAEKAILTLITGKFPNHEILSEESNSNFLEKDLFGGPLWIIDPIDGTTNFAHGHPHVGISIAFADKGQVLAAVVYAPFQNERFTAVKGKGAFLNDSPIKVSAADTLRAALVCTGFPYERENIGEVTGRLENMLRDCRDVRRLGAASLDICWVGCGRMDLFYEDVSPWDMAAASLIAREAGARVGYFRENVDQTLPEDLRSKGLVIGTPKILDAAINTLTA